MSKIQKDNKACIEIYNILIAAYHELNSIKGSNPNLIGVFFHLIMQYTTNFYLLRESKRNYTDSIDFPYLNSVYINRPFDIDFRKLSNINYQFFYNLIYSNLFLGKCDIVTTSMNKGFHNKLKGRVRVDIHKKLFLENMELDFEFLEHLMYNISKYLGVDLNRKIFCDNLLCYVRQHTTNKFIPLKGDILITGTNAKLHNRITSANYFHKNKKTVAIDHGEQTSFVLDEPILGYGEISYCTDYITYGSSKLKISGTYSRSFGTIPIIHNYSSKICESFYSNQEIPIQKIESSSKILYIPTLFTANKRYGPFRDIADEDYLSWQKEISKVLPNATYKSHPKNVANIKIPFNFIIYDELRFCLSNYDVYILDYISTASALCIATDKPIIYFNIGLRNLSTEALRRIKERVFWVDIDWSENFEDQIKEAIKAYNSSNREFINNYTNYFSISEDGKDITQKLIEVIEEI